MFENELSFGQTKEKHALVLVLLPIHSLYQNNNIIINYFQETLQQHGKY